MVLHPHGSGTFASSSDYPVACGNRFSGKFVVSCPDCLVLEAGAMIRVVVVQPMVTRKQNGQWSVKITLAVSLT